MEPDNGVSQKIEIFLSARHLRDLDVFSKSDPYCKVSFKRDYTHSFYSTIGKTQTVKNNLNPNFSKSFIIDYIFETRQNIRFDIYDDDDKGDQDQFIGYVETTVGDLMGAHSQTSILNVRNDKEGKTDYGKLVVRCETLDQSNDFIKMKWKAEKLTNTDSWFDFWDKSDPYIKLFKIRNDNSLVQVHKTEWIQDNLNPEWKPFEVQMSRLVNPNRQAFKMEVWDWQEDGKDQFIGECQVQLAQMGLGATFVLKNPKEKSAGRLVLEQYQVYKKPSFLDYLRGGLELNMIVAIDFTGSNGSPKQPTSLHFMNPNAPNQYQMAINSIAQILLSYDSNQRIPAFGFGAKTNFNGVKEPTSHCFVLSGNAQEVEACGVEHLMGMYQKALLNVELSGPTYFGPLLEETIQLAKGCRQSGSNVYQTLLILTDGEIHDMDKTVELIIQGSQLPLSVIIVGVGQADFSKMNKLDGDGGLYGHNGQKCPRDIVQFVPFREVGMNGDVLAKQLLAELPGQVVQYMMMVGKPPGQPVPVDVNGMIAKEREAKNKQV